MRPLQFLLSSPAMYICLLSMRASFIILWALPKWTHTQNPSALYFSLGLCGAHTIRTNCSNRSNAKTWYNHYERQISWIGWWSSSLKHIANQTINEITKNACNALAIHFIGFVHFTTFFKLECTAHFPSANCVLCPRYYCCFIIFIPCKMGIFFLSVYIFSHLFADHCFRWYFSPLVESELFIISSGGQFWYDHHCMYVQNSQSEKCMRANVITYQKCLENVLLY